jgi:mxaA protein
MRAKLMTALTLAMACAGASAQTASVAIDPVRLYGYVIGEQVELHARVQVPPGYELDASRLPKPGRVTAFLELRAIEPGKRWFSNLLGRKNGAPLTLRFLVVNSGVAVRTVQTPTLALSYRRAGAPDLALQIPQVELTVSPLTPEYVAETAGLTQMQPDSPPPRISTHVPRVRLLLYAFVALGLCGYVAWRQAWVPRRLLARRPFARAAADIRKMRPDSAIERQAARARRLHRAFDEAAGFAVANHSLEQFFAAQPWSSALEREIRDFFAGSARFFYAGEAAAMAPPDRLATFACALAAHEPRRVGA